MRRVGYLKLSTARNHYVYDTSTNDLIEIDATVHQILDDYLRYDSEKVIRKYKDKLSPPDLSSAMDFINCAKKRGFFQPFFRKDFSGYYDKNSIQDEIARNLKHLVLNVTDQCNLRCSYCVYSGNYQGRRVHNDMCMTWDIARKSINYFLSRSEKTDPIKITFYGGEPLLKWKLIKKCIDYIQIHRRNSWPNLTLSVATNATLIHDKMLDYLLEKDVWLYVSIDGPSHVNDSSRVFRNGRGTHATVIEMLKKMKKKDPEYYQRRIVILATFDERNDILPIYRYFSNGIFRDLYVLIRPVKEFDTDAYAVSKKDRRKYQKGMDSLIESYVKSLRENSGFKFSHLFHTFPLIFEKFPQREVGQSSILARPNRVCIPGAKQLFVSSDGLFYTCYNFASEGYDIGDYKTGIDFTKTRKLLENYVDYCEEMCQECWAYRLCAHCFMHTLEKGHFSMNRKKENCIREQQRIAKDLGRYVYILENETEFGFQNEASLHGIVSSYRSKTILDKGKSLSKRINIEDL